MSAAYMDSCAAEALAARLAELSQAPRLLVASDFDGTIAPLVSDPAAAQPDRTSLLALQRLAATPMTHVAVISGRAWSDLAARLGAPLGDAHLVGGHGSESADGLVEPLSAERVALLRRVVASLQELASRGPGLQLETKLASAALHYRNADERVARSALDAVAGGPASWPGVHLRHGKMVVELSVVTTGKGAALTRLRQQLAATSVMFVGDDATDEDAFATLTAADMGVKVGPGETRAAYRVADTSAVADILARLAELRCGHIAGAAR